MKNTISNIRTNCLYAFRSAKFWVAVILYLLILSFSTTDLYYPGAGVYYLLGFVLERAPREILIFICAIPSACFFTDEWRSGRFIYSFTRIKKRGYAISVIFSAFLTALMICVIATTLYILGLSIFCPITGGNDEGFIQTMNSCANGGLLIKGHIFAYYFLNELTQGCCMGIFSAGAVIISVIITNPHITVVSSMVLYSVATNALSILNAPKMSNPFFVMSESVYVIQTFSPNSRENFSVISMLYPYIYTAAVLTLLIFAAYSLIKSKYEKNSDHE